MGRGSTKGLLAHRDLPRTAGLPSVSLLFLFLFLSGCAYSARYPAPMPPIPEGACKLEREAGHVPTDVEPSTRVDPRYPDSAFTRGVQGWVCLAFAIAPDGTVKDAVVIASAPEGYFEEAGLTAVRQWKYQPFRENGKPVERGGMGVMLKFALARP
jgi:TonB family protein